MVRCAAKLLGVAPPEPQTLEEANLSAMARSFYVEAARWLTRDQARTGS